MQIKRTCKTCDGTGTIEHAVGDLRTCYSCRGVGWHDRGEVANGTKTLDERLSDTEEKVSEALEKLNEVLEKLNE